jgi:hypothetical protein
MEGFLDLLTGSAVADEWPLIDFVRSAGGASSTKAALSRLLRLFPDECLDV